MADTIGNEAQVIEQTHAAQKTLGANYSPPKVTAAPRVTPPTGQPNFWQRIQVDGVNLAKGVAESTAKGFKGAATGIARELPGGQADLKAQQQQTANANKASQQILNLKKSGKINQSQSTRLLNQQAKNASSGSSQATKTLKSEPTTKEFTGDIAQTALLAAPGAGKVVEATGADLLKAFGTQGIKDLADKAGVDIAGKGSVEAATQLSKTKIAQDAFKKATTTVAGRAAKSSAKGAAGFGAFSAAGEAGQGGSNKQIVKAGVTGAAEGAVAGAAGSLVKSAVKAKFGKTPTIEKGTAPRDTTLSPINDLGKKAQARTALVGKKAVGGSQASEAIATPKTKLLGTGTGKVEGKGFTASPTSSADKIKISARLNTINQKLNSVAQGKTTMSADDIKALKDEKDNIYKQRSLPNEPPTPTEKSVNTPEVKSTTGKPASTTGLKPVKSNGVTAPSQLSVKVKAKAIENKLSQDLGPAQEHGVMNIKDQANKAAELINTDKQKAVDIATGKRNAPSGIHPHAVFVAVEKMATQEGDADLIRQLASSKRVDESTAAGQTLRVLRERDQDSPVAAVQQVLKARSDAVEKRIGSVPKAVTETAKEIDSHIKPPSKQTWQMFVESIKC